MKIKWDKKYLCWGLTAFLVIAAGIMFYMAVFEFEVIIGSLSAFTGILMPIICGIVFAYLLCPVMLSVENFVLRFLNRQKEKRADSQVSQTQKTKGKKSAVKRGFDENRRKKLARVIGIISSSLMAIFIVGAVIGMIIPQIVQSALGIFVDIESYFETARNWFSATLQKGTWASTVMNTVLIKAEEFLTTWIDGDIVPQMNSLLSGVAFKILGAFNGVKNVLVGLIVAVYLLYKKEMFLAQFKKIIYSVFKKSAADNIIKISGETHKIFGGFITGKILDSAIIGVLCFIGTYFLKIPFPLLISVVVGVTNIIPFFGPFIGAIPCAILVLLVDPLKCLTFVVFIFVLQQFDGNILGPRILGDATGLSGFWVIFAIIVGGGLFGFVGMVIGVPAFAIIYILIKRKVSFVLENKNLPVKTEDYMVPGIVNEVEKSRDKQQEKAL